MAINEKAEKEYKALLEENFKRTEERTLELKRKGVSFHLDDPNYYKDIEDWFKKETIALKRKYFGEGDI